MTKRRPRSGVRGRTIRIRSVRSPRDLENARTLLREYRRWQAEHREVTSFSDSILQRGLRGLDEEIGSLPGVYSPPGGRLFLASSDGMPVGCVALRRLRPGVGELKRLYVRPAERRNGIGRRLTLAVLRHARKIGYRRVVLDSLPAMSAAVELYRRMGFRQIRPYWRHPFPRALFFEYRLEGS